MKVLVTGSSGLVGSAIKKISPNYPHEFIFVSSKDEKIHSLYKKVEEIRVKKSKLNDLEQIFRFLKLQDSEEWLLLLEICEISKLNDLTIYPEVKGYLSILSKNRADLHKLINDGLKLL